MTRDCPRGCVISAIQNYTSRLGGAQVDLADLRPLTKEDFLYVQPELFGKTLAPMVEPTAVEFLVHFVADAHQPMHAGWASDSGGNGAIVSWFGSSSNLHSVWDSAFISRYNNNAASFTTELLNTLKANTTLYATYASVTNPVTWGDQSFQIVRTRAYDYGTDGTALKQWYYDRNLPIVKERLMAAGVRLATLFNALFK